MNRDIESLEDMNIRQRDERRKKRMSPKRGEPFNKQEVDELNSNEKRKKEIKVLLDETVVMWDSWSPDKILLDKDVKNYELFCEMSEEEFNEFTQELLNIIKPETKDNFLRVWLKYSYNLSKSLKEIKR